jgi:hypothetical protein
MQVLYHCCGWDKQESIMPNTSLNIGLVESEDGSATPAGTSTDDVFDDLTKSPNALLAGDGARLEAIETRMTDIWTGKVGAEDNGIPVGGLPARKSHEEILAAIKADYAP